MPEQENIHIQPVNTVAEILGLTPRRIRQYFEDGQATRQARGQADLTWCLYLHIGQSQVSDWSRKPKDPKILIAISWLSAVGGKPSPEDIDKFAELFKRNGFTRDDAMRAIGYTEAFLK